MDPAHGIATGTPVANREYSYDPAGDVTSLNDTVSGDSQCFTYDYVQRLTSAWTPTTTNACGTAPSSGSLGGPAPYWQSYTYDTVGDRTQIVRHAVTTGGTDTTDSYVYASPVTGGTGLVDAVSSVAHAGAVTGTDSYTYDASGDTLTRPGVSLAYDAQDRLVRVTAGTSTERDVYDADGTQLVQVQTGGPYAGATVFLGDTQLFVASGTTTTIGTRTYSVAGQSLAVRVATPSGPYQTALYWTGLDAQHTADQVTRTNTTSLTGVQTRYFDPFGAERGTSPTTWPDQYGFLNNTTNNLTGTTHLGARDYDPTLGKFTTVDPVLAPTDPQSLNGYSYTANNPVTSSDPSGMHADGPQYGYRDTPVGYSNAGYPTGVTGSDTPPAPGANLTQVTAHVSVDNDAPGAAGLISAFNKYASSQNYIDGYGNAYSQAYNEAEIWASFCNTAGADACGGQMAGEFNAMYREIRDYIPLGTNEPVRVMQQFPDIGQLAITNTKPVAESGVDIGAGRFAQTSFSEAFSKGGLFGGRTIDDVAGDLSSGVLPAKDVPINVVVRDGTTLISNTRSAQALTRAGIPRGSWNVINRTGDPMFESLVSGQLSRNGLGNSGHEFPR